MARPSRRLLTVSEACQYLGVSRMTLLAAEEAGLLAPARTPGGHRRYDPVELDRFLNRGREGQPLPLEAAPPQRAGAGAALGGPATLLLREAIRRLTLLLGADATGLYLLDEHRELRWCTSFGIPQWRAAQLAESAPPAAVIRGVMQGHSELFESDREAFPHRAARGCGIAVPLRTDEGTLGALAIARGRDRPFLPSEIAILETIAFYIGLLVSQQRRLDALEARLERVHQLTTCADSAAGQ
ncbi:MAG: helix-turn-helix domain-containing protein [Sphaerobacter sp.]|nr:helix-turn-helix domain-containing protein [Sphaerobacter sp.]